MQAFKTLYPFIKKNKKYYLLGIIALLAVDGVSLLFPQIMKYFVNLAVSGELNMNKLKTLCLALIAMGIFTALGRVLWRNMIFGMGPKIQLWLRNLLFEKYCNLDDSFYKNHMTGDLMAHATNDVFTVGMTMGGGVMILVDSIFMSTFCIGMMFYTVGFFDTLIALSALPILALLTGVIIKPLSERNRSVQDAFSDLTSEIQEDLSGVMVIKGDAAEKTTLGFFELCNKDYLGKFISLLKCEVLIDPGINLIVSLSLVIIMIYGSYRIYMGRMDVGNFVALTQYMYMMIWPMIALGMINSRAQRGIASMNRINEILEAESLVKEPDNHLVLDHVRGRIEFDNVSFRYSSDQPWILKDISFVLEPHSSLAIMGKTGSGKSTIISLILRRYDVCRGRILLDGVDIRELDFKSLYSAFSYVAQSSFLFSGTIKENISMLEENPDDKKIVEAAVFAGIDRDIREMDKAYESPVGERGVSLSGGQKQRITIARARYKDAPILVMDDCLSAVDTETEEEILTHIRAVKKSLILVSQRVSTAQFADQILILQDGKISQSGRHQDLLKEEGFYKDLYKRQLLEKKMDKDSHKEEKHEKEFL